MRRTDSEYYASHTKILPIVAGCLAFGAAGGWFIYTADSWKSVLIGWLGVIFFGGSGITILIITILSRRQPLVVISDEGVSINSPMHPQNNLFLPWEDIKGFELNNSKDYIAVYLHDTEKAEAEVGNIKRNLMKFNEIYTEGAPYAIGTSMIRHPEALCNTLNERLKRHHELRQTN